MLRSLSAKLKVFKSGPEQRQLPHRMAASINCMSSSTVNAANFEDDRHELSISSLPPAELQSV
jgi:hypothetical protein